MDIQQRRHSNRIHYVFGEDEVQYRIEDRSGSRKFSVPYLELSRDRQTLVERNEWLGNVGLLWLALGAVLTIINLVGDKGGGISVWVWLGAACYATYRLRTTRYTIVPSEKGNLLVIDDADGPRILQELERRRAAQFRAEYDFMPEGDTPDQHRNRFKWLHREGALSEEELRERLAVVDAGDRAREVAVAPSSGMLN